jgi:hypothetical protein
MRYRTLVLSLLLGTATCAVAQVSIYIREPNVRIGINLPVYPEFVRVPSYPVYYAPRVNANLFFYDGLYWVFEDGRWYASSWYNGPWALVEPEGVPVYILRVPVRYYRDRPTYFRSTWAVDAPPRWGEYWGATWEQRHIGWDRWDRSVAIAAAPLPLYQRQYSGSRYPVTIEQQRTIVSRQYRYQPRDTYVRQYYRQFAAPVATATATTTARATTVQRSQVAQSASAHAPGQLKQQQGAPSAKEFAPGQVKKREGAQSAKQHAPGQVKKQQPSAQVALAPAQPMAEPRAQPPGRGHGKGRANDDEGEGQGRGQGHGQGHGKGKGHKD